MTNIVLIFSKTNRFPLMSRNNNYWRVMLSAHFVLAKSLVILKAITKRICFHVQCQLASLARKRVYYSSLASVRSLPRGSRTTSLPFVEFLSFLRASPFLLSSSSFICSIPFFFYFCTLCLSLIRYLSFFLLFQLYVLKAVFIDFFCNFCQTPPARPATGS